MNTPWSHTRMVRALSRLVGSEITVFIGGPEEEPEGDVFIASDAFVELLADAYEEEA